MKSDLRYIIKRIIVGVAIALILMLIKNNVFAENYAVTQSSCNLYYGSANTNRAGTVQSANMGANTQVYLCYNSTSDYYGRTGYINTLSLETGYYNLSFMVADGFEISNVAWRSSAKNTYCEMNTGINVPVTTGSVQTYYIYTVNCYNVYITQNQQNQVILTRATNNVGGGYGIRISQNINITPVENISSVINNQSEQQHQDSQNTQNAINNVNDSLTSSTTPSGSDTNSAYSNFDNSTAQNGVITSLITLPIQLFTNINNSVNASCTRFDMGTLLGTRIYFNCIQPSRYLGNQLWSVIDVLMSGFLVWYIAKKFIKVFENLSSLKEGDPVGD